MKKKMSEKQKQNGLFVPEPTPPPPTTVELPQATGTVVINFDELKPNSVLVIKIAPEGMQQRIAASQQIYMALRPLFDIIKEKKIVPIVMGVGETIEIVDEEQMNAVGWHKKEESRIILPH